MKLGAHVATFQSKKNIPIDVRVIQWDDLDDLLGFANTLIDEDLFLMLHGTQLTREQEIDYLSDSIKKVMKGEQIHLVVCSDEKLIGSAQVRRQSGRSKHVGEIGISLSKEYRDQGIGKKMMEILIEQAKQSEYLLLTLTLFTVNDRAKSVYERVGFRVAGTIPGMYKYKDRFEDELIMYKELTE